MSNQSRAAKHMPKTRKNLTLEHIVQKFGAEILSNVPFDGAGIRLSYEVGQGLDNGFEFFEDALGKEDFRCVFFPDTNVAILEDAIPLWNGCKNHFQKFGKVRCAISAAVYSELGTRLFDPKSNVEFTKSLCEALHSEETNWAQAVDLEQVENSTNKVKAIKDYIFLLSMRRRILKGIEMGAHHEGVRQSRSAAMNHMREHFGPRAARFAKKAIRDFERFGEHRMNDEAQIFSALLFALEMKIPVAIVSFDADIFESFYKIQYLLDTNYRETLMAREIAAGNFGKPVTNPLNNVRSDIIGDLTLYEKRNYHFRDILPSEYEVVPVHCFYVSPQKQIDWLTFNFETPMLETLEIRGRTNGASTDLFGEKNIHIQLGPISGKLGPYVGIATDKKIVKEGLCFNRIEEALVLYDRE